VAGPSPIAGVAMVGSEADVIEAFVRHHLPLLDRLVLVVHHPLDETRPILESLVAEGLPLELREARHAAFRQAEEITAVARELLRDGAAFVVLLDADEFLVAPSRAVLEGHLAALPAGACASVPWRNQVPEDVPPAAVHPFARIRLAASAGLAPMTKLALGREFVARGLEVSHGNHALLERQGEHWLPRTPPPILPGVVLAHLPFRSIEQFVAKIVLAWFGNRLLQGSAARISETNWHWRELFDRYLAGETPSWAQMREHALRCYLLTPDPAKPARPLSEAQLRLDPLPIRGELRYTPAAVVDPMRRLACWVEQLLDRQMQEPAARR